MAYPVLQSVTETSIGTQSTSHTISLPATINSGDALIMVLAFDDASTATTPTGWTSITVYGRDGFFYKIADGTETDISLTLSVAAVCTAQVFRITGSTGLLSGIEIEAGALTTTDAPDPPSITPSWGSQDTLFIAACTGYDDDATISSGPSGYSGFTTNVSGGGSNMGSEIGSAYLNSTGTTENPGTFSFSESEGTTAFTIAIQPAAGASLVIDTVSINTDGRSATIKVDGAGTGGTYDFGFGPGNDPSSATVVFTVTSEGYTNGVLGTAQRTVYGTFDVTTEAQRLAYPNQASPNETVNGSDVDIVIPLSDYIYDDDTLITVDIGESWYTESGNSNAEVTDLSVTNSSTEDYPRAIANWAITGQEKITGAVTLEAVAFHGHGIDSVEFSLTDGVTTVEGTASSMSILSEEGSNTMLGYSTTIDTSTLDDGELTADFIAYPNVGDAASVIDTSDAVNTWPTPLYTSRTFRLDTASDHGYTVVDSTNGSDGTGTVYNSQSLAEAGSAYQTVAAALTAIQAYNNTNAGHNDAGGGTILIPDDTLLINTSNGGTMSEWVTITKMSTASKATAIVDINGTDASCPSMLKLEGITIIGDYFNGGIAYYKDSTLSQTATTAFHRNSSFLSVIGCTGTVPNGFVIQGGATAQFGLLKGNSFTDEVPSEGYVVIGNDNISFTEGSTAANAPQNNIVYGFNVCDNASDTPQVEWANTYNGTGGAFIQNLLLRYGLLTEPLFWISADGTTTTTENVILWHNTIQGSRCNFAYNDLATGGPYSQKKWFSENNIWGNWNNKDDTFQDNPDGTGSWPVGYHTGTKRDFTRTSTSVEWFGEFQGLNIITGTVGTPLDPVYVDDQSAYGDDTSGGDYHLQATSDAYAFTDEVILPYDIEGNQRVTSGSLGVYEMVSAPTPSGIPILRRRRSA